ncbi:MAG TPA: carbohydrate kinase family protein [Terriglobia bacterium]|nr:carbohydrate kinase family protein [Terriglobia bacterium]
MTANDRQGIACGGIWVVDLVKVIEQYPQENSIAYISEISRGGGGSAHNVIINLARFDASLPLYALGLIGKDAYGDYLVEECRRFPNVNFDQLRRTDLDATSFTDVFSIKASGRRTFFHYRGTNRLFQPAHDDLECLPVRMFHFGYLLMMDAMDQPDAEFGTTAARFLAELRRHDIRTSIDLVSEDSDRFRHIVPPALKYTDYCIINDWEAEKLTGIILRSGGKLLPQNLRKIGQTILGFGVKDLVVIHFPEGGYLFSKDGVELLQPSLELPDDYIVGSAGAGDSFCAGILYGLYQGWNPDKTLRFAACAGGMNLSSLTTTGGIKSSQEILRLEERFHYRKSVT